MGEIICLFQEIYDEMEKRYRKLLKAEARGKKKKAKKHRKKLLMLELQVRRLKDSMFRKKSKNM